MEEEKKTEEKKKDVIDPMIMVNKTNEAAERMENANLKREQLMEQQAQRETATKLDGKADVNIPKKEETEAEYAERVMANEVETNEKE